jgi:dUTPase
VTPAVVDTDDLDATHRGCAGFGSTGLTGDAGQ